MAEQFIRESVRGGLEPREVHATLRREFPPSQGVVVPSFRTVQRIATEMRELDASEPWSLADADYDAPAVAEVLVEVIVETNGRRAHLTRAEARWIPRVQLLASDLPGWMVFRLAQEYAGRETRSVGTPDVDALLAFAPWRSNEARARYHAAVDDGRLPGDQVTLAWAVMSTSLLPGRMKFSSDWNAATDAERELRLFADDASRRFDDREAKRHG